MTCFILSASRSKDGWFRDLPRTTELSDSLDGVVRFPGRVQGVRLRPSGAGSTSGDRARLSWQGMARRLATRHSTYAASLTASARVPVISANILRHRAATLPINERRASLCDLRALLAIRICKNRPLHAHRFQTAAHSRGETFGCTRKFFLFHEPSPAKTGKWVGKIADKAVVQLVFSRLLPYREFVVC